jgi:hypothetical protein
MIPKNHPPPRQLGVCETFRTLNTIERLMEESQQLLALELYDSCIHISLGHDDSVLQSG